MAPKPLGFGDAQQTARFFGLSASDVNQLAQSGEWPSYVIGGRRVFNLDVLVESLAREKMAVQGEATE